MISRLPAPLYRLACVAWATILAGVFLALAVRAGGRSVTTWRLEKLDQEGQLSIYNDSIEGGFMGMPVELGDYDHDGLLDLVIAPMVADSGPDGQRSGTGEVYIYPGDGQIGGILDRASLPAERRGLTIWGERADDVLGTELFTADVNGDSIDDLILGAQNYDGPDNDRDNAGGAYILFGRAGLLDPARNVDLRNRGEGITRILGATPGERLGIWVEAGDLDGDGFQDLLLGADQYVPDPKSPGYHRGKVYVIYGRESFPGEIDLATFNDGVSVILGRDADDHFGASIHSRDLDADGLDELIVAAAINRLSASVSGDSAFRAHGSGGGGGPNNNRFRSGEVYVFFAPEGGGRLPPRIDLSMPLPAELAGRTTVIHGGEGREFAGEELTTGDFNGDGFPDLVLGALTASAPGPPKLDTAGRAYIIYWQAGLEDTVIDLAPNPAVPLPDGLAISVLHGLRARDILGDTLSVGDFDHDSIEDLAVGIPHSAVDGRVLVGAVAVVFGRPEPFPSAWSPQALELPPQLDVSLVMGHRAGDLMSYSMEARDYDLDGYDDLYPNAMRGERDAGIPTNAGAAYLISGYHLSGVSLELRQVVPSVAPAGQEAEVEILGNGFTTDDDTRLLLADVEQEDFRVVSRKLIVATFPPGEASPLLSLTVKSRYGTTTLEGAFRYQTTGEFVRGDANLDGQVDISDPIATLTVLFLKGSYRCEDSNDANDDGRIDLSDAVYTLGYLFQGGSTPPPPFPEPSGDPTDDDLDCEL